MSGVVTIVAIIKGHPQHYSIGERFYTHFECLEEIENNKILRLLYE